MKLENLIQTIQNTEDAGNRRSLVYLFGEVARTLSEGDTGAAEKYAHRFDLIAGTVQPWE